MNQVEQFVDGFGFGNVLFDALLAAVETDFSACRTYVAVVGVGHFARAVDDAAHDGNLQSFQVGRGGLYAGYG